MTLERVSNRYKFTPTRTRPMEVEKLAGSNMQKMQIAPPMTDDTQTPLSITDSVSREATMTNDTQALREATEPPPQYDYATQQDNWDLGGVIAELRARLTVAEGALLKIDTLIQTMPAVSHNGAPIFVFDEIQDLARAALK